MSVREWQSQLLHLHPEQFEAVALEVFAYQYEHCSVYRHYLNHLSFDRSKVLDFNQIPYLPIAFFKQHQVSSGAFEAETVFESSSTTGIGVSKHFVKDLSWYKQVFTAAFDFHFGAYQQYAHLGLLPNYLERSNSSLIVQVNHFVQSTLALGSQFYLYDWAALLKQIQVNKSRQIPTVLWGVSFALLDLAESHSVDLSHCIIIETGGMKGRRKEITRQELHGELCSAFNTKSIATEYGMTELMSQAYSKANGQLLCPPWMRIQIREMNDPFTVLGPEHHGAINIVDLANFNTCAFIETSDLGKKHANGCFEVLGRMDYSDTRGCSLMLS
jgi:hypothetical protein